MTDLKWPHQLTVPNKLMKIGSKEYEVWKQELNAAYKRADEALREHMNSPLMHQNRWVKDNT